MKFGFYSCMGGVAWGGSEELWFRAARRLQDEGHDILVNYKWWPKMARQLGELESKGADLWMRMKPPTFWQTKVASFKRLAFDDMGPANPHLSPGDWIKEKRPDCVLVTLGYHPDRIHVADDCIKFDVPYAINVQAASNFTFINGRQCENFRRWYAGASRVYFVSRENQEKVETNLATKLDNAEIIDNPFSVDLDAKPPYPSETDGLRLACVGRVHFQSKGQDLIVDVLKQDKWRSRDIEVTIFGKDQGQLFQLKELIKLNGLEDKLNIGGFVNDVSTIWETNHALLLPSRYEGAALVVIEAMICNRACVVTDTGRNRELIDDNQTGFIADFPSVESLDDAMERAWQARSQLQTMGKQAGMMIRERYSKDPVGDYAEKLKKLIP